VGNIARAAAGIGDSGRGVLGVLVLDDGVLARQVDLRQFQYVDVLFILRFNMWMSYLYSG